MVASPLPPHTPFLCSSFLNRRAQHRSTIRPTPLEWVTTSTHLPCSCANAPQNGHDVAFGFPIQIARGFVGYNDIRIMRQSSCNIDAPLLLSRHPGHLVVGLELIDFRPSQKCQDTPLFAAFYPAARVESMTFSNVIILFSKLYPWNAKPAFRAQ